MDNTIKELKEKLEKYNEAYYTNDAPLINDAEYDKLKKQYKELVGDDDFLQSVGGKVLDKFSKVEHKVPMISLNNGYSKEDLENFKQRCKNFLGIK